MNWELAGGKEKGLRKSRKEKTGQVVSNKMDKTVVVSFKYEFTHPLYGKKMKRRRKLKAHDEKNQCRIGDLVRVMETRPLSKEKHWRVVQIVKRGNE